MCRSCLVNDGYLVVPSAEMDVFLGLGHLEQVRKAEKKFVAMASVRKLRVPEADRMLG